MGVLIWEEKKISKCTGSRGIICRSGRGNSAGRLCRRAFTSWLGRVVGRGHERGLSVRAGMMGSGRGLEVGLDAGRGGHT